MGLREGLSEVETSRIGARRAEVPHRGNCVYEEDCKGKEVDTP